MLNNPGGGFKSFIFTNSVWLAFVLSLSLSAVAVFGDVTIGKDSALYLDIARQISEQGLGVATERFNWPGLSIILAAIYKLTNIDLEIIGYGFSSLLMAGVCALAVFLVKLENEKLAPWALLAVISIPAFNEFREDILREYGFWFFSLLAIWLGMVWRGRASLLLILAIHASILCAVLFRLEAIILWVAFSLWVVFERRGNKVKTLFVFNFPLIFLMCLVCLFFFEAISSHERMRAYFALLNPVNFIDSYLSLAERVVGAGFEKYLHDEAGVILGFLLFSVVVVLFVKGCGFWVAPFLSRESWQAVMVYWRDFRLLAIVAGLYLVVLMCFLTEARFLNTRYVSFLHLLMVPFFAAGLAEFCGRYVRLGRVLVALLLVGALANVVSLGAKKTHFIEAGQWIKTHSDADARLFVTDERIRYYAGRGYQLNQPDFELIKNGQISEKYDYYALETKPNDAWLKRWVHNNQYQVLATFSNSKKQTVVIFAKRP